MGRVQYGGRGLVHRLPWPENSSPRAIVPESVLGPSREELAVSSTKRKRGRVSHGADGVVVAAAKEDGAVRGPTATSSNGNAPGQSSGRQSSSIAPDAMNGDEIDGAGEQRDATQQQGLEGGPPQTDAHGAYPHGRCSCPCFCGHRDHTAGRTGVDTGNSRAIARAGIASADLSRVEQLVGGAAMARGCALGVGFVARATELAPGVSVSGALDLLDGVTAAHDRGGGGERGRNAGGGLQSLFFGAVERAVEGCEEQDDTTAAAAMASFCGGPLVALPRRFEVAAALHRLPGVKFRPAAATELAEPTQATSSAEAVENATERGN